MAKRYGVFINLMASADDWPANCAVTDCGTEKQATRFALLCAFHGDLFPDFKRRFASHYPRILKGSLSLKRMEELLDDFHETELEPSDYLHVYEIRQPALTEM